MSLRPHFYLSIFSVLLVFSYQTLAQSYVDIFSIDYKFAPRNTYTGSDETVRIENISYNLTVPIPRKNGDVFLFGSNSDQLSFYGRDISSAVNRYYYANVQMGYQKKWHDSLSTVFMLIPRISSDFEDLTDEDYQLGFALLFSNKRSDDFAWKYGFYVNSDFFGPFFTPLMGFDWKVNEKWRIFGALPATMTGEYKISNRLRTGARFIASANSYRLSSELDSWYMHHNTNHLSGFLETYVTKMLVLKGQVGFTAFRNYRLFEKEDKVHAIITGVNVGPGRNELEVPPFRELSDGLLFQLSLIFRYDLEKGN